MICKNCNENFEKVGEIVGGLCSQCRVRFLNREAELNCMKEFVREMCRIREEFSDFAREIDRCIYDVGQNFLDGCGHDKCVCQMSFEQFHELQNLTHGTGDYANV